MRYKLDSNGYFSAVFFGCNGLNCLEYNGDIPVGFLDNIKAYKLIDGVIVYDEERAKACEAQCKTECDNYHHTTKQEVLELIGGNELAKNYCVTVTPTSVGGSHCWEAVSAERYKCKISASEHTLVNPYIDDCIVYKADGTAEKTILDLVKTVTDDLVIYSNLEINCKIILKGA